MIHHELKKLRQEKNFTLKELATKVGYGTGNLSSYENGKLKAKDETLSRILTRGYGMSEEEAAIKIAEWRKAELEEVYEFELSQNPVKYNEGKNIKQKTLDEFLRDEGFDEKTIKKIKRDIDSYR